MGSGPSWKYRGLLQLEETALPSWGGGTDRGMAGSGRAGPQGHRVRSNRLSLWARGGWSGARETQSRQSPQGGSVLALPRSAPSLTPEECRAPPSGTDLAQGVGPCLQARRGFSLHLPSPGFGSARQSPPETTAYSRPAATALVGMAFQASSALPRDWEHALGDRPSLRNAPKASRTSLLCPLRESHLLRQGRQVSWRMLSLPPLPTPLHLPLGLKKLLSGKTNKNTEAGACHIHASYHQMDAQTP